VINSATKEAAAMVMSGDPATDFAPYQSFSECSHFLLKCAVPATDAR